MTRRSWTDDFRPYTVLLPERIKVQFPEPTCGGPQLAVTPAQGNPTPLAPIGTGIRMYVETHTLKIFREAERSKNVHDS